MFSPTYIYVYAGVPQRERWCATRTYNVYAYIVDSSCLTLPKQCKAKQSKTKKKKKKKIRKCEKNGVSLHTMQPKNTVVMELLILLLHTTVIFVAFYLGRIYIRSRLVYIFYMLLLNYIESPTMVPYGSEQKL